jgi:hypothetical protein
LAAGKVKSPKSGGLCSYCLPFLEKIMNIGTIFWTIAGLITVGIGIFMPQMNRLRGTPSQEERFTVPKFKQTAQLNGRIARAVLILLGLGMIINGVGPHLLPPLWVSIIGYTLVALAFLGILLMIIITTGNWRV